MISTREIIFAYVVPIVITLLAFLAARRTRATVAHAGLAIAIIIAFFGTHIVRGIVPVAVEGWFPYLILFALSLGFLKFRFSIAVLFCVIVSWLLIHPLHHAMASTRLWMTIVVLAGLFAMWCKLFDASSADSPAGLLFFVLGCVAGASAIHLLNTGQDPFGKLAGAIALVFFCAALVCAFLPARIPTLIVATALWSLLILGCYYGTVNKRTAGILLLAPLITWRGQACRSRPGLNRALSVLPALILIALVTVPAVIELRKMILQTTQGGEY